MLQNTMATLILARGSKCEILVEHILYSVADIIDP